MRLAYLNSKYPSLSHTFIEREIRALRQRGFEIHTFSVRRPGLNDCRGQANAEAAATTYYLIENVRVLMGAAVRAVVTRPVRLLKALRASQRLAPPGLKSRLTHTAYVAEAARLTEEMKRRGLRHVHVHMANSGAAIALIATVFDPSISYSLSIHGSAEFFHVDSWTLQPKAEGAAFVRCISHFCRSQVMAWTKPQAWSRFHIVHCGVDPRSFSQRPPLGPGPLRILTVGRFEAVKGYPFLLQACRRLSNAGIPWHLDMVGDGRMMPILKALADELCITDNITFSGAVDQDRIHKHFDEADLMVVSSFMEGVPVVLMEAMAKGLGVVATRVGGIPELIHDGVDGILVVPGCVESLTDALERLARDRTCLESLTASARQRILNEYSIDQVADGMAALFRAHLHAERVPDVRSTPETPPPGESAQVTTPTMV